MSLSVCHTEIIDTRVGVSMLKLTTNATVDGSRVLNTYMNQIRIYVRNKTAFNSLHYILVGTFFRFGIPIFHLSE